MTLNNDKQSSLWLRTIYDRINRRNRGCFIAVTGEPGVGKSYAALSICHHIDATFHENLRDRVVTSVPMFRDLLKLIEERKIQRGNAVLIDEAGCVMNSREAMRGDNIWMGKVAMTIRNKNLLMMFTAPTFPAIDKRFRELINYLIEPTYYNSSTNLANAKIFHTQYNTKEDKLFYHQVSVNDRGEQVILTPLVIPKIPDDLAAEYEKIKSGLQSELYTYDKQKIATLVMGRLDEFSFTWGSKRRIYEHKVIEAFKITPSKARAVKKIVEADINE
jgi:hypothetical protein